MWDPEFEEYKTLFVTPPLPKYLTDCLGKLQKAEVANAALRSHREAMAKRSALEAFCQKYSIGIHEKEEFKTSPFWNEFCSPRQREDAMRAFAQRAGDGLPSLSFAGDHSRRVVISKYQISGTARYEEV